MTRKEQMGLTHSSASAEPTRDWKDQDTVTVTATLDLGQNSSQKTTLQLTEDAAQVLLSDLLRITTPPRPTFDMTVETTDSFDEHEDVEYVLRHRQLALKGKHGNTFYNFDRVLRVTAVPHEES